MSELKALLDWHGKRYPTFKDLEAVATHHDVKVVFHPHFDCPRMFWHETVREPWVIGIPEQFGPLARMWALAHEIGHLVLHDGPVDVDLWRIQEDEADAWAACGLIPEASVRKHNNANVANFIRALAKHYQPFKPEDPVCKLAAFIAHRRFDAHQREAV